MNHSFFTRSKVWSLNFLLFGKEVGATRGSKAKNLFVAGSRIS